MKHWIPFLLSLSLIAHSAQAQTVVPRVPYSYDESKVGNLSIPELLVAADGTKIDSIELWEKIRRPELLKLFQVEVFGKTTEKLNAPLQSEILFENPKALHGKATMRISRLRLPDSAKDSPFYIEVLSFLPNRTHSTQKTPVFVGLNFAGNQTTIDDSNIPLPIRWIRGSPSRKIINNRGTDISRGTAAERWPFEEIIDRGYGIATAYYGDISLDNRDFYTKGFPSLFELSQNDDREAPIGSISAWAWGLSRIADYLRTLPQVAEDKIAVVGHSRLGKTALWAGAQDTSFGLVISNNSGASGAALSRRIFGERIADTYGMNPHWFTPRYRFYASNEEALPLDQHQLIALVAPRPVYIASASEDLSADPKGEFLGGKLASPAWELYGKHGLLEAYEPPIQQPIGDFIGYHCREGKHNILSYDWQQFMNFADRHWGKSQTSTP